MVPSYINFIYMLAFIAYLETSIFAFIQTKALPKRVFSLILHDTIKILPNRCFLYFCPYSTQSLTKKDVFLYFCPYSNQNPTKIVFFSIFAIILTKTLQKRVFLALQKWLFALFSL